MGALGGGNATGASYRALIHAGWCCGMSEEATASPVRGPPHGRRRRRHLEGETTASGLHGVDLDVGLAQMLLPGVPLS